MIAKCALFALLAVVAAAAPQSCGCSSQTVVLSTSGCSSSSGAITKNYIAKGKYPVALKNCGPTPDQQIPVTTSRVTAPVQEKPTVRLASNIPAPKVISHCCTCYKTILRPRVNQQIITVPTIQRYIETTHKPVIENIQYEAIPVNCEGSGSSCGSSVQVVQVPRVQVVEAPRCQTVEVPRVQLVQAQCVQAPKVQTIEIPQTCESLSCNC